MGTVVEKAIVCEACLGRFKAIKSSEGRCEWCQKIDENKMCEECVAWKNKYGYQLQHYGMYDYNEWLKEWIKNYKYQGDYRLAQVFKREVNQKIKQLTCDVVVPIPLSEKKENERGFNQVSSMLYFAQVPYEKILEKKEESLSQSGKNREERLHYEQPFSVINEKKGLLKGKRVLVVDDVYTTGTTIHHAVDLLYENGAKEVESLSLGR